MEVKFPTIVYKVPGEHHREGGTYSYAPAKDESQFNELIKSGWFPTLQEAVKGEPAEAVIDEKPITREEIEEMAKELNIEFRKSISDTKLLERVNSALDDKDAMQKGK